MDKLCSNDQVLSSLRLSVRYISALHEYSLPVLANYLQDTKYVPIKRGSRVALMVNRYMVGCSTYFEAHLCFFLCVCVALLHYEGILTTIFGDDGIPLWIPECG